MAEAVPNLNWNQAWNQAVYGSPSPIWQRINLGPIPVIVGGAVVVGGRRILRESWDNRVELVTGFVAGSAVRHSTRVGVALLGLAGWEGVIVGGAVAGGIMGGGREWVTQARENWRQPINPAANRYAERLRDSLPSNWARVGLATGRGALFGAAGGLVGGFVTEKIHDWMGTPPEGVIKPSTPATPEPITQVAPVRPGVPTTIPTEVSGQPTVSIPKPQVPGSGVIPGPEPTTPPIVLPGAETVPFDAVVEAKVQVFEHNHDVEQAIAGEVGKYLAAVPESSPFYAQVQHILEVQGHDSTENALRQVLHDHPNFDVNNLNDIQFAKDAVQNTFERDYIQNDMDSVIKTLAHLHAGDTIVVDAPPVSTHDIAENMTKFVETNQDNHQLFVDHVVQKGETAGHLIQQMGVEPTWDGRDLYGFVALSVSNPDQFKDIASGMGLSSEELLKLLYQADHGDVNAAHHVYKGLSLIKAGAHIKLPTHEAVAKMADLLKNSRLLSYAG